MGNNSYDLNGIIRNAISVEDVGPLHPQGYYQQPRGYTPRTSRREAYYIAQNYKPQKRKVHKIKNLVIALGAATILATVSIVGYSLVKSWVKTPDIVTINNFSVSSRDFNTLFNQKRAGEITESLLNGDYESLTREDIDFFIEYYEEAILGSYDKNRSTIMPNFEVYFSDKAYFSSSKNSSAQSQLLEKFGKLYRACFDENGERIPERVNKFLTFGLSLTIAPDTVYDTRGSGLVPMHTQSFASPYATQEEVNTYHSLNCVYQFVIDNTLEDALRHSDFHFDTKPAYYFGGTDKLSLDNAMKDKVSKDKEDLYNMVVIIHEKAV